MVDDDVAEAARVLAETYETASRGIIYRASGRAAQRSATQRRHQGAYRGTTGQDFRVGDADVAVVLRRIEHAAREARSVLPGDETAYLEMLKRILRDPGTGEAGSPRDRADAGSSGLIVPGR